MLEPAVSALLEAEGADYSGQHDTRGYVVVSLFRARCKIMMRSRECPPLVVYMDEVDISNVARIICVCTNSSTLSRRIIVCICVPKPIDSYTELWPVL